ncbi:MAG: hypothetical protein JO236_02970 [Mycobacterium sp.]|uniref:hypothetical protein n=1 Tax=Mycobacterium sp. TaxID=1785 RepID=UPI001EB29F93|nr:hypothetical protein [Mycobacterium sp.]MBW0016497.1 hypothetical protein [Mycobacterium sp.]
MAFESLTRDETAAEPCDRNCVLMVLIPLSIRSCHHRLMILAVIQTMAAVSVPIVVAIVGYKLNHRLKLYEASQWRNQELIKARLQYFGQLAPMLNDLMCYLTFIGRWKELTPPEVIVIKRDTDRLFYSVAPLFSQTTVTAYQDFVGVCFNTHNRWGVDARICSGFLRRREASRQPWRSEWEELFTHQEGDSIKESSMTAVRAAYDKLLAALVADIELLQPRDRYADSNVVVNAR